MILLAGSVAPATLIALMYKKPASKLRRETISSNLQESQQAKMLHTPKEGIPNPTFSQENIKNSFKSEENSSANSQPTEALSVEEPSCALALMKSYGQIFSSPAMAVLLGSHQC